MACKGKMTLSKSTIINMGHVQESTNTEKQRKSSRLRPKWGSSNDSIASASGSNLVTESEISSDSEFEEHAYSRPPKRTRLSTSKLKNSTRTSEEVSFELVKTKTMQNSSRCTSKNAIMARMNRIKKKKYVANLESKNNKLEAENEMLKTLLDKRMEEVVSLKREAANLRSVIRNSTEIGSLLRCVQENTNLQISSSLLVNTENLETRNLESRSSTTFHSTNSIEQVADEEAFVAAVLWGMALHTFCQPHKQSRHGTSSEAK